MISNLSKHSVSYYKKDSHNFQILTIPNFEQLLDHHFHHLLTYCIVASAFFSPTDHYLGINCLLLVFSSHKYISSLPPPPPLPAHVAVHMQNHATHIHMLYLSPYIVTDLFCGTLFPFYFVIKR